MSRTSGQPGGPRPRPRTPHPLGRIVLVQPRVGYMDSVRSKPALPLSLLHAGSLAAQRHEVVIIDQRVQPDWQARLRREMRHGPRLVGLTCYTGPMIGRALEVARLVRALDPDVPIVWGGVHAALLPEDSLRHPLVDLVACGEGEATLAQLAETLSRHGDLAQVPGLAFRDGDRYVATPPATHLDLSTAPEIPYHLVDIEDYLPLYEGRRSIYLETSRGCPHSCTYCYNVKYNHRRWRAQSADRVVGRAEYVRDRFGVQDIYFTDDNFFLDPGRARTIAEGMRTIGVSWQVQGSDIISIDAMDEPFLRMLQDSRFRRFTVGIESGSPRMRRLMNKRGDVALIRRTIERLARFDFIVFGSFISGMPDETLEDVRQSVMLIEQLHRANRNFRNSPIYHYIPFPGTLMFDQAVAAGFRRPDTLAEWATLSYEGAGGRRSLGSESPSFYERLYLATLLNDRKVDEYTDSRLTRTMAALYRPIAAFRLGRLYFDFMPEMMLARLVLRSA